MKYGVNIMVWTTRMNREQEALLSRIKERGFHGVELFLSLNEQANIPEMRRTLHPLGLHRTTSFVLPSDANFISTDADVRARSVAFIKRCVEPTRELDTGHWLYRFGEELFSPKRYRLRWLAHD
jgi:D-psicose/D-tagatose/L-ribulose 3-epimerase